MSIEHDLVVLQLRVYSETQASGLPASGLMPWLVDQRNLDAAWDRVQRANGAHTPGMDGVVCGDINGSSARWLRKLADDLRQGTYRPAPPRWIQIPRDSTDHAQAVHESARFRRIGILTVRDRVVHTALKQILEPVLDVHFSSDSFGFRPGRCVAGALQHVIDLASSKPGGDVPFGYAVCMDVADCFETIDHALLIERLRRFVRDDDVLALLALVLEAGGVRVGPFWNRRSVGLLPGSALSPLLCNLYLDLFDKQLATAAQEYHHAFRAIRYADDLLLLARDRAAARQARRAAKRALRTLHQRSNSSKTSSAPIRRGFNWLGVRIEPRRTPWTRATRLGYRVPEEKVAGMIDRLTEMTAPPSSRLDAAAFDLGRWIVSLNTELKQWRQVYLYADNAPEVFRALDDHARHRLGRLLCAVHGVRWREVAQRYRLKLPRGFWTWEVDGVRLATLSSLAPHAPYGLTRRPAWQRHMTVRADQAEAQKAGSTVLRPAPAATLCREAS